MPASVSATSARSTNDPGTTTATLPDPTASSSRRTAAAIAALRSSDVHAVTIGSSPVWRIDVGGCSCGAATRSTRAARSMIGPGTR